MDAISYQGGIKEAKRHQNAPKWYQNGGCADSIHFGCSLRLVVRHIISGATPGLIGALGKLCRGRSSHSEIRSTQWMPCCADNANQTRLRQTMTWNAQTDLQMLQYHCLHVHNMHPCINMLVIEPLNNEGKNRNEEHRA